MPDIYLMGAVFHDVPAVDLPIDGGGTATFTDVSDTTAAAEDVASGKYFYTANGVRTEGTASGGGGAAIVTVDTSDAMPSGEFTHGILAAPDATIYLGDYGWKVDLPANSMFVFAWEMMQPSGTTGTVTIEPIYDEGMSGYIAVFPGASGGSIY